MTPIYIDPSDRRWNILLDGSPRTPEPHEDFIDAYTGAVRRKRPTDDGPTGVRTIVEPVTPARITFEECEDSPRDTVGWSEWSLWEANLYHHKRNNGPLPTPRRIFRLIEGEL